MAKNVSEQPWTSKPSRRSVLKSAAGSAAIVSRGGAFPMPAAALFDDDATCNKTGIALHAGKDDDIRRIALGQCLVNAPTVGAHCRL